jgi:hypothetical protein
MMKRLTKKKEITIIVRKTTSTRTKIKRIKTQKRMHQLLLQKKREK